jgi:hypothetical protein
MTQSPDDQLAVVLGQRQLIAVCCMFLVVLGLVATMAYVTGRSITAAQMRSLEKSDVPPAIVVDPEKPPQSSIPAPMQAKAETLPPNPASAPVAQQPTQSPLQAAAEMGEPTPGQSFWQVGLVDRGLAPVFVEYMTRQGFRSRLAAGQSAGGLRVLVGPLTSQADAEKTKRALDAMNIQAFLKKY